MSEEVGRPVVGPTCTWLSWLLTVGLGWRVVTNAGALKNRSAGVGDRVGRGLGVSQTGALVWVGVSVSVAGTGER